METKPIVKLTRTQIADRVADIARFFEETRRHLSQREILTAAWEKYVEGEQNPELRRLSEIVADARRQVMIQRQLDDDRERLHHERMDHHQHVALAQHYDTLREEACVFNHSLRRFIEGYAGEVNENEVMEWLMIAGFGAREWAESEVIGAVSEIALLTALKDMPELSQVRHATVEEDLHGFDFMAVWRRQPVTIDAKTGLYPPLTLRKRGHRHLEVSVPRQAVRNLRLTPDGLSLLMYEIREALGEPVNGRGGGRLAHRLREREHWQRHSIQRHRLAQ